MGTGGAVSAWRLSAFRKQADVTVVDKGKDFNFLPLLPDSLGRNINPVHLAYPIEKLSSSYGFRFLNEEVKTLDPEKRTVTTSGQDFNYDYLIIACGSETNFYGNVEIKKYAYKLDDAKDAARIRGALEAKDFDSFIIGGGGYTGIEIATNLRVYLNRKSRKNRILIVERAPSILGPLPEWMKNYVLENLNRLNIELLTNTVVEKMEEDRISLSGGQSFDNSMLIWAAGVKTPDFLQNLKCEKNPQGRLKVDECLRLTENCFAIGDASNFAYNNAYLRMAVQFAIAQAHTAVFNIMRHMAGKAPRKFIPKDIGYLIPMANNSSCGNVLGRDVRGKSAIALHYLMSFYRAYGFKNKLGILKALMF